MNFYYNGEEENKRNFKANVVFIDEVADIWKKYLEKETKE